MKTLFIATVVSLLLSTVSYGQFYSGKYQSSPQLEDFDHFVVHQHPHHHKYGGDLTVKAFVDNQQLWHATARLIPKEQANDFTQKFASSKKILSVYELDIELDGEEWEYFLLGYEDENKKSSFVVVEEIFDIDDTSKALEINTFEWNRVAHHHQ